MSTSLLLPSNGSYHLATKGILYFEDKKKEYHIALVEKTKNYYIKDNKTLCNHVICTTFPHYLTSFK
jgi:hypothetical protein